MEVVNMEKVPSPRKFIMLYDTKSVMTVLSGVELATSLERRINIEISEILDVQKIKQPEFIEPKETAGSVNIPEKMSCSTCGMTFETRTDQVGHFKSDWHRLNIRQKLKGRNPVTEAAFEQMNDVSSISGSDSDSESSDSSNDADDFETSDVTGVLHQDLADPRERTTNVDWAIIRDQNRHEKLYFQNDSKEFISIHRCAVYSKKTQPTSQAALRQLVLALPLNMKWAVFMAGGGHFAAAIFDKEEIILHKTFHRYVVRAKAGTAQSSRDNQGHAPKSGGATLRRYNEAALAQEIQELITSWSSDLNGCSRIFLRAPSFNRAIFFGGKTPVLDKNDPRLHHIAIRTRRPTLNEVKRIHKQLATVECLGNGKQGSSFSLDDLVPASSKKDFPARVVDKSNTEQNNKIINPRVISSTDKQTSPDAPIVSDTSSDEYDVELQLQEMTLDTLSLREYECTKKPRRKKKPAKTGSATILSDKVSATTDAEHADQSHKELFDLLYTACKTGDTDSLKKHLTELSVMVVESTDCNDDPCANETIPSDPPTTAVSIVNETPCNESLVMSVESSITDAVKCIDACVDQNEIIKNKVSDVLCRQFGRPSTTLLHVAAQGGHKLAIKVLLEHGADPTTKDGQSQYAYVLASSKEAKNEFRRFMARYPDKFDYARAQIPGPLTSEMETAKKAKLADKKKIQMKAKKERLKEEKLEEDKRKEEENKRKAYLALSDREKRAMAAEQRLKVQLQNQTGVSSCRCWQCGADMTGKIPFEYYDFKFCTPGCLKEHKLKASTN